MVMIYIILQIAMSCRTQEEAGAVFVNPNVSILTSVTGRRYDVVSQQYLTILG